MLRLARLKLAAIFIQQSFDLHRLIIQDRKLRLETFVLGRFDDHTFWELANL